MKRVDRVFNPPKPKVSMKSNKPQVSNRTDQLRSSESSISSFSRDGAGGSVKLNNEKKNASPIKKGVSMHT